MSLWKTTITIWSENDPSEMELDVLAEAAMYGDAYCSSMESVLIRNPQDDDDWDGTDMFGNDVDDDVEEDLEEEVEEIEQDPWGDE